MLSDAITTIKECRQIHLEWAEYFEDYPDAEKQIEYKHLGGGAYHREWVQKYDEVLAELEKKPTTPPAKQIIKEGVRIEKENES